MGATERGVHAASASKMKAGRHVADALPLWSLKRAEARAPQEPAKASRFKLEVALFGRTRGECLGALSTGCQVGGGQDGF